MISIYDQMQEIKKNIASVHNETILFEMNRKYRELENELNNINVYL